MPISFPVEMFKLNEIACEISRMFKRDTWSSYRRRIKQLLVSVRKLARLSRQKAEARDVGEKVTTAGRRGEKDPNAAHRAFHTVSVFCLKVKVVSSQHFYCRL